MNALREKQHNGTLSTSSLLDVHLCCSREFLLVSVTSTPVHGPPFLTFVFADLLFASFWLKSCHKYIASNNIQVLCATTRIGNAFKKFQHFLLLFCMAIQALSLFCIDVWMVVISINLDINNIKISHIALWGVDSHQKPSPGQPLLISCSDFAQSLWS